jgi:hypothetical protein
MHHIPIREFKFGESKHKEVGKTGRLHGAGFFEPNPQEIDRKMDKGKPKAAPF